MLVLYNSDSDMTIPDDQDKTVSHAVILVGTQISQYRVDGYLGAGGMGEVYRVYDTRLNRNVALKFLPVHLIKEISHRSRFMQEAQAAAQLNHPNIVTIYEVGEFDGRPFIAMEYLEGETLKSILKHKSLSPEAVIEIMREIASGVAAAHSGGIIHRDLKPDNIMISADHRVKIMDFGLAHQISSRNNLTRTGSVMGTPHYMSPEQIQGEQLDPRTDIFSLGIIFYELLAGSRPFDGDYHLAVLYAIVNHQPQPLEELAPFAPTELVSIAMKCLAKQKEERFHNGEVLFAELRSIGQQTTPVQTPRLQFISTDQNLLSVQQEMVGREAIVAKITDQLRQVLAGHGATIFASGEAGIGKSRFASAISGIARSHGMNVLHGRCLYEEGQLPYHPFASALKSAFIRVDDHFLASLTAKGKTHGVDLTPLIPVIKSFLNISSDSITLLNKEQLWDAVLSLLSVIATERPILLIIDDLQWADKPTLALFSYLARSSSSLPIMLVGLHREEERREGQTDSGSLEQITRQLRIDNIADMIELKRFTMQETVQLLVNLHEGEAIDPRFAQAVYDRSLGNPLFSIELVKLLRANNRVELVNGTWRLTDTARALPVPQRVQDVIINRLEGIGGELRELLEFASCEGESFPSDILVGCLKRNRIEVLKILQALEKEHALIRHKEHLYYFDHPLIREVLYDGILPELREEYHRLIADWLIERHAKDREYASRIAHHLLASRQNQQAVTYLLLAADQAKELYALENASGFYQKALTLVSGTSANASEEQSAAIHEGLGDTYFLLGKTEDARNCFDRLLTFATVNQHALRKAVIQRKLSEVHRILGNTQESFVMAEQSLAVMKTQNNNFEMVRSLNALGFLHFNRHADWRTAMPILSEALTLAKSADDTAGQIISLNNLALAHVHQGDFPTALQELEEAKRLQNLTGDIRGLAQTENHLGLGYFPRGRFEEAIHSFQASLDIRRRISDNNGLPGSINGLADAYRELGDVKKATGLHLQALDMARQLNNKAAQCDNLRDLGVDMLKLGDFERAGQFLHEGLALSTAINHLWYQIRTNTTLGLYYWQIGNMSEAESYSVKAIEMARQSEARELIIDGLWVRGKVVAAAGRFNDAIPMLEEAITHAKDGIFRSYLWRMERDVAELYRKANNPDKANQALAAAKETINEIISFLPTPEFQTVFLATPGVKECLK